MIEIASCMNDLAEGAVWVDKNAYTRFAKIASVWFQEATSTTLVGFYLWDSQSDNEDERVGWKVGKVMNQADFEDEFQYADLYVLNQAREAEKNAYLIKRLLGDISNCFDVEQRMEGRELVKKLMTLTKRSAGYDVVLHEWDEGCAGVGCCADTAEMAGDKLIDENFLAKDEVAAILSDQE